MKGAGHCSFHRAGQNGYFEKVLLITSIGTYNNLLNNLIFADSLLREGYQQCAPRKQSVIAPFKDWFKRISLRKCN